MLTKLSFILLIDSLKKLDSFNKNILNFLLIFNFVGLILIIIDKIFKNNQRRLLENSIKQAEIDLNLILLR